MSVDLQVTDVSLQYHTKTKDFFALKNVSFTVAKNEFVAVLGPSGCGKSSLIKLISGLVAPTAGKITLGKEIITGPTKHTGVVFQKPNLLPWKTVLANVLLPQATLHLSAEKAREKAIQLLSLVGLSSFERNYPFELSGGMAQRVGIARMLLSDPDLLLMDEPFAALDALSREQLTWELLRIWSTQKKSVLFITHSIPEAVLLADRVLVMSPRPGHVMEDYTVPLTRPRTPAILQTPTFTEACHHLRAHFLHE